MKIEIKKMGAIFSEVGKGEVFMIGSAVYMRTTGKEDEYFNAWSFNLSDIAHIGLGANVIIPQKVTLEVTL